MKRYIVTAKLKFPSYYHSGYEFEICAKNKAEAIKYGRKQAFNEGHTKQDGPLKYSAVEAD